MSGVVEPRRNDVTAELSARLVALHVHEGDRVEAGETLAEFDCAIPRAELARAQATHATATAQRALVEAGARTEEIAAAEAGLDAARQQLAAARSGATADQLAQIRAARDAVDARIRHADASLDRVVRLADGGNATPAEVDAAQAQVDTLRAERTGLVARLNEARHGARSEERAVLQARVDQAEAQLAALRAGSRPEERALADRQVAVAESAVSLAAIAVERCTVRSPVSGTVDIVDYEVGEFVGAGRPMVAISRDDPPRIRTFASQTWIANLQLGDALDVRIDGSDTVLVGRVAVVHEVPSFTAGNVQTPNDRVLLVYRLDLDVEPVEGVVLRPGMTVTVLAPEGTR